MAEYVVNTQQLNNCASQLSALQRELDSVAGRLACMQLGSILRIRASTALIGRIGDCKWAAVNQSDDLGRLARGLEEVACLYENCETGLSEPKTQAQAAAQVEAETEDSWWHDILEAIDGFPIPVIDAIGSTLEEVIPGIAGNIASWAVSLFQNVIGNYLEFENWSPEMIYEIIGETGIDIAMGGIASLAIGAICVAAGVTPVGWAVAGGAVVVTWIVDSVCEWITDGRDVSEVIVDWLWEDVGLGEVIEGAAEAVDNAIEAVDEFIDDAVDTVREGAEAIWDTATDVVAELWPF